MTMPYAAAIAFSGGSSTKACSNSARDDSSCRASLHADLRPTVGRQQLANCVELVIGRANPVDVPGGLREDLPSLRDRKAARPLHGQL